MGLAGSYCCDQMLAGGGGEGDAACVCAACSDGGVGEKEQGKGAP